MALPKKGLRKISVDEVQYNWIASGNDGWIDLYIESSSKKGRVLTTQFDYNTKEIPSTNGTMLKQQFSITPETVRQVILFGLKSGWNPEEKGKPFVLSNISELKTLHN